MRSGLARGGTQSEPRRFSEARTLEVLSDPEAVAAAVDRAYRELGHLIDEDDAPALLADALCHDCPIVGVTNGFVRLTGYSRERMLGRNCRVLLDGVPEVAISKSGRKNLRDFCRMCLFPGMSQLSEVTCMQANARLDGSQFTNFFTVGLCFVDKHPYILGVQTLVGEGLLVRMTQSHVRDVAEESRATLLRLRDRLCASREQPPEQCQGAPIQHPDFGFYSERLQDHCILFDHFRTAIRREPHELATNCLVFSDTPVRRSGQGLFFALLVSDVVGTFDGLPVLGFTKRKPVDAADLYPSVAKCLGASVLIGACGEAFARDKHEHFCIGFKLPPSSEVQTWALQPDTPPHKRSPPFRLRAGDTLGCLYTYGGRLQLWRNGAKTMDFDVGRPVEAGIDYFAVVDVCFSACSVTLISMAPPPEAEVTAPLQPEEEGAVGEAKAAGAQEVRQPIRHRSITQARRVAPELAERAIRAAVAECGFCVTVADPRFSEVPLVAVSEGFEAMTGYGRQEILGKNCRFLNEGCHMSAQDLMGLRCSSRNGASFTALLPNRKKSGEMFVNLLDLQGLAVGREPRTGEVLWYCIGIQADVTSVEDDQIPERHAPQRQEVARQIRERLRHEARRAAHVAAQAARDDWASGASDGTYELLVDPFWMSGSECGGGEAQGCKGKTLHATMPPSSPGRAKGLRRRTGGAARAASFRAFSKHYNAKAAAEEAQPKASLMGTMSGVLAIANQQGRCVLNALKGWMKFTAPAIGAICLMVGALWERSRRR